MISAIRPPFTEETARAKVRAAQDAWNSRDPERVALAYTEGSQWRNRDVFLQGRDAIKAFLTQKWAKELDYRLMKELWAISRQSYFRAFRIRMARRRRPVVSQPRQRALGIRRWRPDAPPRRQHQRLQDFGIRPSLPRLTAKETPP